MRRLFSVAGYATPFVVLTLLFLQVDHASVLQTLLETNAPCLLAAAAIYPLTLILDAIAFGKLLPSDCSLRSLLCIRLFSEPFTLLPGGALAADATKPYLLSRECDVEIPNGIAAVAGRKLLIVLSHSISLTIASCLGYRWLESIQYGMGAGFMIVSLLFLLAMIIVVRFLFFSAGVKFGNSKNAWIFGHLISKHLPTIRSAHETLRELRNRPSNTLTATGLLLLVWFLEAIEIYLIGSSLVSGVALEGSYIAESFSSFARSVFAFIPAGAGVQELSYNSVLSAMGMGLPIIAAISLLRRSREIAWAVIGGIVLLIVKATRSFSNPAVDTLRPSHSDKQTGTLHSSVPVNI